MENKKNGLIFIVSGPSGSGKGTIVDKVKGEHDDIFLSISWTTRKPRGKETGRQGDRDPGRSAASRTGIPLPPVLCGIPAGTCGLPEALAQGETGAGEGLDKG